MKKPSADYTDFRSEYDPRNNNEMTLTRFRVGRVFVDRLFPPQYPGGRSKRYLCELSQSIFNLQDSLGSDDFEVGELDEFPSGGAPVYRAGRPRLFSASRRDENRRGANPR